MTPNKERQRKYKLNRKRKGYTQLNVWIRKEMYQQIREFASEKDISVSEAVASLLNMAMSVKE